MSRYLKTKPSLPTVNDLPTQLILLILVIAQPQEATARLFATSAINASEDADSLRFQQVFESLVGGTWTVSGTWSSGVPLHQRKQFEWGPRRAFIQSKTMTSSNGTDQWEQHSTGIRQWQRTEKNVLFWEFDRFGGVTEGRVGFVGEHTFYYEYSYLVRGQTLHMRDTWTRIDNDRYTYTIGQYEGEALQQTFLEAEFRRMP